MLIKAMLATVIATSGSPAVCDDLRSFTVTVMEQTRHEIVVEPFNEYAARSEPYWKRAEPQDRPNHGGDLLRQMYRRIRVKLPASR
jgi:hypothetical protein